MTAPELKTSVSIIPGRFVDNRDDRLVVLNRFAHSIVAAQRGTRTELSQVGVHDLKPSFGRRLPAAGMSFEDRQDLLGHNSDRITTHYSAMELTRLIEAANQVCERGEGKPSLVVLRRTSVH